MTHCLGLLVSLLTCCTARHSHSQINPTPLNGPASMSFQRPLRSRRAQCSTPRALLGSPGVQLWKSSGLPSAQCHLPCSCSSVAPSQEPWPLHRSTRNSSSSAELTNTRCPPASSQERMASCQLIAVV